MTQYNIYFGTIGKTLGCKYRFTKSCKTEQEAKRLAENSAMSFYYKNEGKYGIPSFNQISKEAKITGLDIEILYKDHIKDMMRFYAIPTDLDSIPNKKLKF
jgi:hypothetical protein